MRAHRARTVRTPVRTTRRPAALAARLLGWSLALAAGTLLAWLAGGMLTGATALAATPASTTSGRENSTNPAVVNAQQTTSAPLNPTPVTAPLTTVAGTAAAPASVWDNIAKCESGGNWKISTGNGYHGGLQFKPSTWKAFGGTRYASTANKASKAQQIEIAEKVQARQGWGAWPTCSKKAGSKKKAEPGKSSTSDESRADSGDKKRETRYKGKPRYKGESRYSGEQKSRADKKSGKYRVNTTPTLPTTPGGPVTIAAGDTLAKIAKDNNVVGGWQALYESNKDKLADPNLIRPGQQLTLTTK